MARHRMTKKQGRSLYAPKNGKVYSRKQLYGYFGGAPGDEVSADEVSSDVKPSVNELSSDNSVNEGSANETLTNEPSSVDGEGNVAGKELEPITEVDTDASLDKDIKEDGENVEEDGKSEKKTGFLQGVSDVGSLIVDSASEEYNNLVGSKDSSEEKEEPSLLEEGAVSNTMQKELEDLKNQVNTIILGECEELKEKIKTLESENKQLKDELLGVYKQTSTITSPSSSVVSSPSDVITPESESIMDMGSGSNMASEFGSESDIASGAGSGSGAGTEFGSDMASGAGSEFSSKSDMASGAGTEFGSEFSSGADMAPAADMAPGAESSGTTPSKLEQTPMSLASQPSSLVESTPPEPTPSTTIPEPLPDSVSDTIPEASAQNPNPNPDVKVGGKRSKRYRRMNRRTRRQPKYRYVY